ARAVHVRPVRGADVLDPDAVAARLDPRVVRRGELVAFELDVVRGAAPERHRLRVQLEALALGEARAAHGHQRARPGPPRPAEPDGGRMCGDDDQALLREAHVARQAPDDPPDEEVEEHEEADLEDEQDGLNLDRGQHHSPSWRNEISVEPIVTLSPWPSCARCVRTPFTSSPFVEPRSTIQKASPSRRTSACRRDAPGSASWTSESRERPRTVRSLASSYVRPPMCSDACGGGGSGMPSSAGVAASVG